MEVQQLKENFVFAKCLVWILINMKKGTYLVASSILALHKVNFVDLTLGSLTESCTLVSE